MARNERCPNCEGEGRVLTEDGKWEECATCSGLGYVELEDE